MAFRQEKLQRSVRQSSGIFNKYIYETSEDTIAEVQVDGYFAESRFIEIDNDNTNGMGWRGGIIECSCSNGYFVGQISEDGTGVSNAIPSGEDIVSSLTDGQVPQYDSDTSSLIYAGATVDQDTGVWTFDNSIEVPSGSLKVSDILTISEATYELVVNERVTGQSAVGIQSIIDDTGSYQPFINAAGDQFSSIAQGDFSTTITTNPIVLPLVSSSNIQTNTFRLKVDSPMTNVRLSLVDDLTGVVLKYIPSRRAVETGDGGLDFPAGDIEINLNSDDDDTTSVFNLGFTPLRSIEARSTTLTIEADNMSLLGNAIGVPYVENELQKLFQINVPYIFDTSNIEDNYSRLNAGYVTESGTTGGLVVNYEATSTKDTVTTQLFNEGVDGSANPFVITDGSDTFATSDIIQITGTKLNNGFYEVLSHAGTTLTIRGVGLTDTVEEFSRDQWLEVIDSAEITKINVNVLRSSSTGVWQTGSGSTTPITYTDIGGGSGDVVGPASSVDQELTVFDGTSGTMVQGGTNVIATVGDAASVELKTTDSNTSPELNFSDSLGTVKGYFIYDESDDELVIGGDNGLNVGSEFGPAVLSGGDGVSVTASNNANATISTSGTGNVAASAGGTGSATLSSSSGTVNVTASAGDVNLTAGTTIDLISTNTVTVQTSTGSVDIEATAGNITVDGQTITLESNTTGNAPLNLGNSADTLLSSVYLTTTTPEGSITASPGSLAILIDTVTPANTGLYQLHSSVSANTPWVLIGGSTTGGDVDGPSSSVDTELAVFNGTTGKEIEGTTNITAVTGATNSQLSLNTTDNADYPTVYFNDSTSTEFARIEAQTDDDTVLFIATADHYISAGGQITLESDTGNLSLQTLGQDTINLQSNGAVSVTSNNSNNITIGSDAALNMSGAGVSLTSDADNNLDIETSGSGILGVTSQGTGDVIVTATNADVGIVANSGQIQLNTQDVEMNLTNGQLSTDGAEVTLEQGTANQDIGITFNDNTSTELNRIWWDESLSLTRFDASANFLLDAGVQMNLSGGAECSISAGLTMGVSSGNGTFIATSTTDQFPLAITNSGTNGTRTDVYTRNSSPEGALTATVPYSYCFVTGAATAEDNGLWMLDSAVGSVNTPWVQIASTTHTQDAVTGPSSSIDNELAIFNGTTGDIIQGTTNITAETGQNNATLNINTTNDANYPQIYLSGTTPTSDQEGWIFLEPDNSVFGVRGANSAVYSGGTKLDLYSDAGDVDIEAQSTAVNITAATSASVSAGSGNLTLVSNAGNIQMAADRAIVALGSDLYIDSTASEATGFAVTIEQAVTNGGVSEIVAGSRNPVGSVNATNERIYLRSGSGNSDIYVGDGTSNTDWTACAGRGAPWQWGNNGVNSSTTPRFMSPGIDFNSGSFTNENNARVVATRDGYFQRMRVRHNDTAGNGNDIVYTLRVNGVDTALSVTLASTSTTAQNNGTKVQISSGDLITLGVTKASGVSSSPTNVNVQIDFF